MCLWRGPANRLRDLRGSGNLAVESPKEGKARLDRIERDGMEYQRVGANRWLAQKTTPCLFCSSVFNIDVFKTCFSQPDALYKCRPAVPIILSASRAMLGVHDGTCSSTEPLALLYGVSSKAFSCLQM